MSDFFRTLGFGLVLIAVVVFIVVFAVWVVGAIR